MFVDIYGILNQTSMAHLDKWMLFLFFTENDFVLYLYTIFSHKYNLQGGFVIGQQEAGAEIEPHVVPS